MVLLLSKTTRIWKQNKWCQFLEPGKNSIIFFDRILSCEWAIFGAQTSRFDMDIIHGWVRFGNPDFGFCNRTRNPKTDFTFEKSVLRVNFIKKSKSGFHGFPFYRLIGKSVKGFAKLFSWTTVLFLLIMRTRARTLFLRAVFRILFRISQSNGKKEIHEIRIWISQLKSTLRTDFSEVKSVFGFRIWLRNPDLDFENLNPDFPIERTLGDIIAVMFF